LPWAFLAVGLFMLGLVALAAIIFAVDQKLIIDSDVVRLREAFRDWTSSFELSDATKERIKGLATLAGAAITTSLTLLASWHFAEMRLPQRLQDLKDRHFEDHKAFQGRALSLARAGRVKSLPDIETSRLVYLRDIAIAFGLLRGPARMASVLAASRTKIHDEALTLDMATREAQEREITACLIRGYQLKADRDKAFKEFSAATKVRSDHILSRDIAAGWARGVPSEHQSEIRILEDIVAIAELERGNVAMHEVHYARAVRRKAELRPKTGQTDELKLARDELAQVDESLTKLGPENIAAQQELARVLTLFCEVQCARRVVVALINQNGAFTRLNTLANQSSAFEVRAEEPFSEHYTAQRVQQVWASMVRITAGDDGGTPAPASAN
jgi:hypothetical protein